MSIRTTVVLPSAACWRCVVGQTDENSATDRSRPGNFGHPPTTSVPKHRPRRQWPRLCLRLYTCRPELLFSQVPFPGVSRLADSTGGAGSVTTVRGQKCSATPPSIKSERDTPRQPTNFKPQLSGTMANLADFCASLVENRRRKQELSLCARAAICTLVAAGQSKPPQKQKKERKEKREYLITTPCSGRLQRRLTSDSARTNPKATPFLRTYSTPSLFGLQQLFNLVCDIRHRKRGPIASHRS